MICGIYKSLTTGLIKGRSEEFIRFVYSHPNVDYVVILCFIHLPFTNAMRDRIDN